MAARILVAEKNPLVRASLQEALLGHRGYEVSVAATARTAVAALVRQPPFDFALLDCSLSPGNDFALATQATNRNTPFLLMTTDYRVPGRFPDLAAVFITKPFPLGELFARVQAALGRAAVLRSEAAVLLAMAQHEKDRLAANLRLLGAARTELTGRGRERLGGGTAE